MTTIDEIVGFFLMACEEELAALPGDAHRDERVAKAAALVASLYEGHERELAEQVIAGETQRRPLVQFVVRDFVAGDKVVA